MRVLELIKKLSTLPNDADVTVRTLERGEVCLTVDLTELKWTHEEGVMLIGDLDTVNAAGAPVTVGDG